jgi:EAL domain-containing protein (putative c-di-GMP-specific phosphodiesterase class I)
MGGSTGDACVPRAGRVARLRDLGFRLAVDDLGSGYAGHVSLAVLEPEVVKLDMGLVRGLDLDLARRDLVRSTISLCRRLGCFVFAQPALRPPPVTW